MASRNYASGWCNAAGVYECTTRSEKRQAKTDVHEGTGVFVGRKNQSRGLLVALPVSTCLRVGKPTPGSCTQSVQREGSRDESSAQSFITWKRRGVGLERDRERVDYVDEKDGPGNNDPDCEGRFRLLLGRLSSIASNVVGVRVDRAVGTSLDQLSLEPRRHR